MSNFNSPRDAAKKLGISVSTFRTIVKNGEITFIKIGKRKKFTDEDISKYLQKDK